MKSIPYKHQQEEYDEHKTDPARALLWQMRCGKTKSIIDNACYLWKACEITGVIVIAPNGVHYNWVIRELNKHHWDDVPHVKHAWRFSDPKNLERFKDFLRQGETAFPWFTINMESLIRDEVRKAVMAFIRRHPNFLLVVDESHHFAKPGAKRTSMARALARRAPYRRILSGTSVENRPLQAFSQFELLEKGALGYETFGPFKERYAVYVQRKAGDHYFPALDHYENLEELRERMGKYSSVVLRSDCEDLPPVQRDVRYVEMGSAQLKAWYALKEKSIEDMEKLGLLKPTYGGALMVKLQQIEGGYLKAQDGALQELVDPENNPKMQALLDEVQAYDGQVIAWFAFVHEIRAAAKFLRHHGYEVREFHGSVPDKERDKTMVEFERGLCRVLLGQPRAGGEGRDFSTAGKILWYSQTPDAVTRNQASERATRVGGTSVQMVDLVVHGGVCERYLAITEEKTTVADMMSRDGMRAFLTSLNP